MSSGFYKNAVDIREYTQTFIGNATVYGAFKTNVPGTPITNSQPYTPSFTAQIDETLANVTNYKYNNTDLANFMIASFVESSTTNFTNTQIPSWCNKLRVVLIGAGAGGSTAQASYFYGGANWNQQTASENTHQCNYYNSDQNSGGNRYQNGRYDVDFAGNYNQQAPSQNTAGGGGGGGGGAFIYLPSIDISSTKATVKIQVGVKGTGGAANRYANANTGGGNNNGTAGGSTNLQISGAAYSVAGGGSGAAAGAAGAAGTATGQSLGTNSSGNAGGGNSGGNGGGGGNSGCSVTYSNNATIKSYGVGGAGSSALQGVGWNAGGDGTNGYYRVYFLTS